MSKAREPKQTRRQFLKEFVGPPRRPRTPEEREAATAAYERSMAEWRAQCGDLAKRKNNFHRVADAERDRGTASGAMNSSISSEMAARRAAAIDQASLMCAAMTTPTRTINPRYKSCFRYGSNIESMSGR